LRRPGHVDRFAKLGTEIHGKTLGIIGIGTIGSRVSELCNGLFGMRVIAYDPYLDAAAIAGHGAQKVGMDELLAEADYVTVHCPRTDETMGMMGKPQFDAMKPSAFFINTARGGIHDEAALADALREGRIAGAGLDVFLKEPPPHDHPLMKFDNVMVSPHIAGITVEATRNMAESAALQWITLFEGAIPPRLINPEAWPRYQERFEAEFGFRPPDLPGKGGRAAR
jgi:D-3-phosphoglycerate dehydrogenase